MNRVVDFINVNRDRYVEELKEYLAIVVCMSPHFEPVTGIHAYACAQT
jgi:hypothetical protein